MVGWAVVGSWNGESWKRCVVVQMLHPAVEVGGRVDRQEGHVGKKDTCESLVASGQRDKFLRLMAWGGRIDPILLTITLERQTEDLAGTSLACLDTGILLAERVNVSVHILASKALSVLCQRSERRWCGVIGGRIARDIRDQTCEIVCDMSESGWLKEFRHRESLDDLEVERDCCQVANCKRSAHSCDGCDNSRLEGGVQACLSCTKQKQI